MKTLLEYIDISHGIVHFGELKAKSIKDLPDKWDYLLFETNEEKYIVAHESNEEEFLNFFKGCNYKIYKDLTYTLSFMYDNNDKYILFYKYKKDAKVFAGEYESSKVSMEWINSYLKKAKKVFCFNKKDITWDFVKNYLEI